MVPGRDDLAHSLTSAAATPIGADRLLGISPAMRDLRSLVRRVAQRPAPILLLGESGTGKGLCAHALHEESLRRSGPFVTVDCASIPEHLLESELFGSEPGAFTGATTPRAGRIETSHGGTLFLDEVATLSLPLQSKLLRVLETGEVTRLGASRPTRTDFWLVASSNRDLERLVAEGNFRADLYYRLRVIEIRLRPLRERRDDIPELAHHFLIEAIAEYGLPDRTLSDEAIAVLRRAPWRGNVRELANRIAEIALLADGPVVTAADLPADLGRIAEDTLEAAAEEGLTLEELEKRYIAEVLRRTQGRIGEAARILGIHRKTLLEKRKRYGLVDR